MIPAETLDPRDFTTELPPSPPPPQIGLRGSVGSGKTRAIVREIKAKLAADPAAVGVVFVPDHDLAPEMARRLEDELGASFPVAMWRGLAQPDPAAPPRPPIVTMCRRLADVQAVLEAGGETRDVCGSRKRGLCPFHPDTGGGCGYIAQGRRPGVRVWVLTHAMLGRPAPVALRRYVTDPVSGEDVETTAADFVVIDESFWTAMLGGFGAKPYTLPVAAIDPATWPVVPDAPGDFGPGHADKALRTTLGKLAAIQASATPNDAIGADVLAAAGLDDGECLRALGYAFRCKVPLPSKALPSAAVGAVGKVLGGAAGQNARVIRVAKLLRLAADILAGHAAAATVRVIQRKGKPREITLRWREDIHPHWLQARDGVLHADATMRPELVRAFLPGLVAPGSPPVAAPHMRVVQVEDRVVGYSMVVPERNKSADGQRAATNNARRVARVIERLAQDHAGKGIGGIDVLAVVPKALEKGLAKTLPPNVRTLHFGKLRGQDAFKSVSALLVVSRLLPGPREAEDTAEVIYGRPVARLTPGAFYPTRPGLRVIANGTGRQAAKVVFHPDPDVEAVRWSLCEAELVQAIGRGRGIHRTATDPLTVYVLTNVPLEDVPVSELVSLDDVWRHMGGADPVAELERAGILPLDWRGRGALLAGLGFFEGAADPGVAARKWFQRNPAAAAKLAGIEAQIAAATLPTNPAQTSISSILGGLGGVCVPASAGPWTRYRYRMKAARNSALAWVRDDHVDPRREMEAAVGPLARFDLEPARARPQAAQSVAQAAATDTAIDTAAKMPEPPVAPLRTPLAAANSGAALEPPSTGEATSAGATPPPQPGATENRAAVSRAIPDVKINMKQFTDALVRNGSLSEARKRQLMTRYRMYSGSVAERDVRILSQIAVEVGAAAMVAAGKAAVGQAGGAR